jgi:hypothetical protein
VRPSLPAGAAETTGTAPGGGLVRVRICRDTFVLANKRCPSVVEVDLEPGLVPTEVCRKH